MSIGDVVRSCASKDDGRLVLMTPLLPGSAHVRLIYATSDLHKEIVDAWGQKVGSESYRIGLLHNELDRFSGGDAVTVGYGTEKTCFMKLLDPKADQIWEMRCKDPKPSYRIFGRFSETDVFIATHLSSRTRLKSLGSVEWGEEVRRCKATWRRLLHPYPPLTGDSIHDYISDNVFEVGDFL